MGGQTTPKHAIKVTKGPVPEIFHPCIKECRVIDCIPTLKPLL
jgi:hypothetical protein